MLLSYWGRIFYGIGKKLKGKASACLISNLQEVEICANTTQLIEKSTNKLNLTSNIVLFNINSMPFVLESNINRHYSNYINVCNEGINFNIETDLNIDLLYQDIKSLNVSVSNKELITGITCK